LKHRFINFIQVAFWPVQETENELNVRCENMNHRFIDFI